MIGPIFFLFGQTFLRAVRMQKLWQHAAMNGYENRLLK